MSHSIDADEFKESLLYENGTNILDGNEYIKHFLLLVLQAIAMFVVSIFKKNIWCESNDLLKCL